MSISVDFYGFSLCVRALETHGRHRPYGIDARVAHRSSLSGQWVMNFRVWERYPIARRDRQRRGERHGLRSSESDPLGPYTSRTMSSVSTMYSESCILPSPKERTTEDHSDWAAHAPDCLQRNRSFTCDSPVSPRRNMPRRMVTAAGWILWYPRDGVPQHRSGSPD